MNILQKLMTLFRGSVREIGESVVDANGTRIFEQEIKDAEVQLKEATGSLTLVMAKAKQAERELDALKAEPTKTRRLCPFRPRKRRRGSGTGSG